ncbi:MAG TPA: methyltransferase domain-containing protein [Acidimicrobiales bacterium]|nr:methyltransferase domain-containing protein [Acidimicrobiales bacterium]
MPYDRDVQAFHDRAPDYESGFRGRMHHDIVTRTAGLALDVEPKPRRVLDVGCGTGLLLRLLAERRPDTERLEGIDAFDLIISTTSFDHWRDQRAGLDQCYRVLAPGGHFVLTDLFSLWLAPTLICGHRGRARTKRRAQALLKGAGFRTIEWHNLYTLIISTVVARKQPRN